jgi:hypothetical protein
VFPQSEELIEHAQAWGRARHPNASQEKHAAFVNSVFYARSGATGPFGGPSLREHIADQSAHKYPVHWAEQPLETLLCFLEPLIYGPLTEEHLHWWILHKDICFDDDPADLAELEVRAEGVSPKDLSTYQSVRLRPQIIRDLQIIAALTSESMIDVVARLAQAELRRLRRSSPRAEIDHTTP